MEPPNASPVTIVQPDEWKPGWNGDRTKFRFVHSGHRFTIFLRDGSPFWQVKFKHGGAQILTSLKTGDHAVARKRAAARWDAIQDGEWFRRPKTEPKPVQAFARMGEIVDRYMEGIVAENPKMAADSRGPVNNSNALLRLVTWATGAEDARVVSCEVLNAELVADFRAKYLAAAGGDEAERESRKRGGDATLRLARAVFSKAAMRLYAKLRLPELDGFRKAQGFHSQLAEIAEIDAARMKRIATAALELRESRPELYLVHLLLRHAALRPEELANARWGWIEQREDGGGWVNLQVTPGYKPKTRGRVPLPEDVMAEINPRRRGDAERIVACEDLIRREHSAWLKPFLPEGATKTNYELRRWAGSTVFKRYGSDAEDAFLRHSKRGVGARHYRYAFDWSEAARKADQQSAEAGVSLKDCWI